MQGMTLDAAQKGVTEVPKATLRQVVDSAIERAFIAGAEWALICTGVDSPKAGRRVDMWMRSQEQPSLRIIQQATREQLYKALIEITEARSESA